MEDVPRQSGLTLTESIMYQSEENLLDFRILNPQ
jgi:hypothetical protein